MFEYNTSCVGGIVSSHFFRLSEVSKYIFFKCLLSSSKICWIEIGFFVKLVKVVFFCFIVTVIR